MLPTPNELDTYTRPNDEKEELPLYPELVNQLLRGPVLQTDCSAICMMGEIMGSDSNLIRTCRMNGFVFVRGVGVGIGVGADLDKEFFGCDVRVCLNY